MPTDGTENDGENFVSVIELKRVMNFTLDFFHRYQEILSNNQIAYNIRILFFAQIMLIEKHNKRQKMHEELLVS